MADEETSQEPKKVCVLDKLAKSSMNLDALKRNYNDHKKTDKKLFSLEQFASDFDEKGFSLWRTEYNYNDELTGRPEFIIKNSLNGMIQGMDYARKYAFCKLLLLDADNDTRRVVGFWVLRGDEPLPEVLDDMCTTHTWTKLSFDQTTRETYDQAFYGDSFENMSVIYSTTLL